MQLIRGNAVAFSTEATLDFGEDTGIPVDHSSNVPASFNGSLGRVKINLKEDKAS